MSTSVTFQPSSCCDAVVVCGGITEPKMYAAVRLSVLNVNPRRADCIFVFMLFKDFSVNTHSFPSMVNKGLCDIQKQTTNNFLANALDTCIYMFNTRLADVVLHLKHHHRLRFIQNRTKKNKNNMKCRELQ